ncbi:Snf7 family protein [Marine Group I thaumarchaeote]|jgi:division protein CdvB (Snf7/Vps24/ESCRT-III family)|uniref:Snf7 family protein n=1 Tax=Marine Group I thaumarchaeote TaxID=2511932 RepID=A0A7K4MK82_9ARCH|nr:Snf7 family protein [Marine Group I thaumarchaeote]
MSNLSSKWSQQPKTGITEKINDSIKPKGPLKPRISNAVKKLQSQISKLDSMLTNLQERDAKLFQRIVEATQKHDTRTTKVLGNELAEIRKVTKILSSARIALEQIELRLSTCSDLGDTVVAMMPTVGLMKNLKSSLGKIMPGAEQEIGQMAEILGGFMTESFSGDTTFGVDESTNAESENILKEAAAVAESSAGQMFPSVPTNTQEASTSKFL